MVNDVCLLKDEDAFRCEWKLARVVDVYPDRFGNVRNVEILVKPEQDGSSIYKPTGGQLIRRHVNNLLVLVPVEDQDAGQPEVCAEGVGDKTDELSSRNDEENRCTRSSYLGVDSQSNLCQNLQEPGSTSSPQDDLEGTSRMSARRRGDWYQVPLIPEDEHVEDDCEEGDVKLHGSFHEEFPQVKEAEVLCGLGKFWGDC